ncbi:MAG: ATP-binding cassette domain-containing protein [Candidatus Aminicenantes bacterium]|nr:ATP-binding cassette domain-containing protein [Candidatus Aminicenantes bacterium]
MIEIRNISKNFDSIKAVDNLSLEIPPGVIYGILGPNGAGKTTTLRIILNIIEPDKGEVLFGNRKVDLGVLNRVGYLPEERGLYQKEKAIEVLIYLAQLKGLNKRKAKERALELMEKFDLADRAYSKIEELSKGMQQKLQFISTLVHDPEILILDEPFSGLDPINSELLRNLILEEKARGKTVIFSTHILEQAEKMCDFVALISKGKKVVDGKLSRIKADYGKRTIKIEFEGDGEELKNLPHSSLRLYGRFAEIETDMELNEVLKELVDRVKILRAERTEPTLSQIYFTLVGGESENLNNNRI